MHKGIFITGTDTGVGKTFVAVGLITALKKLGYSVCPMKPVETGCRSLNGRLVPADALKLICAAEVDEPLNSINPYRFRQPVAPAVAAGLEGVVINKQKIFSAYRQLSDKYDITFVEGAGGIMVPIWRNYLFLDFIKDLKLPVVIVARLGLGTINHTLLSIEAARNRGINVLGVVLNDALKTGNDISVKTNMQVIEHIGRIPVMGKVAYFKNTRTYTYQKVFRQFAEKILSCD